MKEQAHGCDVVAGFLKSYATCVAQAAQENVLQSSEDGDLWLYLPNWAADGEGAALFLSGLQEVHGIFPLPCVFSSYGPLRVFLEPSLLLLQTQLK
ncbi:hypothetical protein KSF_102350 [Reticulibacter mediterranei]|uniref:Uncharacterized protein n=1 Tax=Reticulibacter mediterranei TaxID=2778369 RepID=A0A8J3NAA8_9CHLR|nr:hypothetical protein KSF_102350 [Reticulibacter mediterranei]